jgi:phage anti-repressor protein
MCLCYLCNMFSTRTTLLSYQIFHTYFLLLHYMKQKDSIFIKLLKKHTNINTYFINTFFKKFKINGDSHFDIKDTMVAKYLKIKLSTLRRRLQNIYSNKQLYYENVDYIKVKSGKTSGVTYMLNYQCFENLAMTGDTEEANTVRLYFIKLREFIRDKQHLIYQAIENKKQLHKYKGFDTIYFFAVKKNSSIF